MKIDKFVLFAGVVLVGIAFVVGFVLESFRYNLDGSINRAVNGWWWYNCFVSRAALAVTGCWLGLQYAWAWSLEWRLAALYLLATSSVILLFEVIDLPFIKHNYILQSPAANIALWLICVFGPAWTYYRWHRDKGAFGSDSQNRKN